MPSIRLEEFFVHKLREGPRDPAFKPAPEVKPMVGGDPTALGATGDGSAGTLPQVDAAPMTQDVAPMPQADLDFFSKNVASAVQKVPLDGFDAGTLTELASALDSYVYGVYSSVADPQARAAFESDYQKAAADWSRDIVKFLDRVKKLEAHAR